MSNELRYFSMFTGVGGFELGLSGSQLTKEKQGQTKFKKEPQSRGIWTPNEERRNNILSGFGKQPSNTIFTPVGFSEIDKYASELLKQKFPNVKNYGDAKQINPSELPDFDMLCGGFPCQAFSIAGKRRGFEDTRGTLFFEIARILEVKRPKIILLENVKGLLNHEKGKTFGLILETLDELGYETQWMVLNSKFFGVPQNRERVFIIGNLRGECKPEILPFREGSTNTIKRIQQRQSTPTLQASYGKRNARGPHIKQINNPTHSNNRIYGEEGISPSLNTAQGGNRQPKINIQGVRRLTPTECERLQGFPDGWTEGFSDTQRYKMMGNAVTVNVIKAIGEKIAGSIQSDSKASISLHTSD